jgi:hypothetical protein
LLDVTARGARECHAPEGYRLEAVGCSPLALLLHQIVIHQHLSRLISLGAGRLGSGGDRVVDVIASSVMRGKLLQSVQRQH